MFRFFLGLVLAQVAIALLVAYYPAVGFFDKALPIAFMITLLATVISLWFSTVAKQLADKRIHALHKKFAAEREKMNQNAERDKDRLIKKTNKQIEVEARRVKTKANVKIWGAVAIAGGFGVMMLLTQFVTLGLLTLTTAGGVVGGYLARVRKEQQSLDAPEYKFIEAEVIEDAALSVTGSPYSESSDPDDEDRTIQSTIEKRSANQPGASG